MLLVAAFHVPIALIDVQEDAIGLVIICSQLLTLGILHRSKTLAEESNLEEESTSFILESETALSLSDRRRTFFMLLTLTS